MTLAARITSIRLLLTATLLCTSCDAVRLRIPISQNYQREFNYVSQSGQDWESGQCRFGRKQSPVDFPAELPEANGNFTYRYALRPSTAEISNARYIYLLDLVGAGYGGITYLDMWFPLLTITVHARSEHTVGGVYLPAELHLVHKNDMSSQMVVVAIPLNAATPPVDGAANPLSQEGDPNFNLVVQKLVEKMPQDGSKFPITIDQTWDLNTLFGEDTFLTYEGSLTKPPCTEIVRWLVKAEPLMVSDAQAQLLHNVIYASTPVGNARATMPLNGREVGALKAALQSDAEQQTVASADEGAKVVYGTPPTDREVIVRTWTANALKIAEGAVTQTAELDAHAKAAAEAAVKTLNTPYLLMGPQPGPVPAPAPAPMTAEYTAILTGNR